MRYARRPRTENTHSRYGGNSEQDRTGFRGTNHGNKGKMNLGNGQVWTPMPSRIFVYLTSPQEFIPVQESGCFSRCIIWVSVTRKKLGCVSISCVGISYCLLSPHMIQNNNVVYHVVIEKRRFIYAASK